MCAAVYNENLLLTSNYLGWRKKGPTDHEHTMLSLSLTLHDFALGVSSMAACYVQKSAASVIVLSDEKVICRDKYINTVLFQM